MFKIEALDFFLYYVRNSKVAPLNATNPYRGVEI